MVSVFRCRRRRMTGLAPSASRHELHIAKVTALCCSTLVLASCSAARTPTSVYGVRALYRSIGIAASSSAFTDICESYMDGRLRDELEAAGRNCFTSHFEHWAERVRLSKIKANTRIVVSGHEALVYDGSEPERAVYLAGQWLLDRVPELGFSRARGG